MVVLAAGLPRWSCDLAQPPPPAAPPIATTTAHDEHPVPREVMTPPVAPAAPSLKIADDTVMRALDRGRAGFLYCFHRAQRADPTLVTLKINVHLAVDASGAVTSARTDVSDPQLAACLVRAASRLTFPAPEAAAVADLTFLAS